MVLGHVLVDGGGQDAEVPVEEKDDEEGEGGYGGKLDYCPDLLGEEGWARWSAGKRGVFGFSQGSE